jgi:RNA chaperone Hfq
METNLLDRMLDLYLTEQTPVTITLQNKIRVSGKIKTFDSYVIIMEGHKREVLYRHAVSCLSPLMKEELKHQPAANKPAPAKAAPSRTATPRTTPPRPAKAVSHKPRQQQPQALSPSTTDSLSNSMKDGLLKWMQEQKAAK